VITVSKRAKRYTAPEFTPGRSLAYTRHAQAPRRSNTAGPHTHRRWVKGNRSATNRAAITASREESAA
jgi:intein-encoded DNA endonuclease-like protein